MTPIDTTRTLRNVVDGELVDSLGDSVDRVINPATEEVLAEAPRGTARRGFAVLRGRVGALPKDS